MSESIASEGGLNAQVNIFKDFRAQRSLEPRPGLQFSENRFRELVTGYSGKAFDELTDKVGLDSNKLEPIKIGNQVVLDQEEKQKVIDHLLSITGISDVVNRSKGSFDRKSMLTRFFMGDVLKALESDLEIIVTGPLVTLEFKSSKAMSLFNIVFTGGTSDGFSGKMPIGFRDVEGRRELIPSDSIHINFIDLEAEKQNGQNIRQHEEWHTVDRFRQIVYAQELKSDPAYKTGSTETDNPDRFYDRLSHYLYNPKELSEQLRRLKEHAPELYNFYVGTELDEDQLKLGLYKGQHELSACIAGYINEEDPASVTDAQRDNIAELLLRGYLPFGANLSILRFVGKKDEESGRFVVDESRVDEVFNPQIASIGEPPETWTTILNRYSERDPSSLAKRQIIHRDEYVRDMQFLFDHLFNPGGYGYETMTKIERNFKGSIDSFRELSQLRGDPYKALFELSLLPISHWNVYTKRQPSASR
ncbi:MAG TPA: hypothetical protein VNW29_01820 [Candidatus Sulfotelmatobacter sp.]|jgi:hypothetical protein|nr:hypothetical protein [Candidatus Sulfotelmatobacter sp.]